MRSAGSDGRSEKWRCSESSPWSHRVMCHAWSILQIREQNIVGDGSDGDSLQLFYAKDASVSSISPTPSWSSNWGSQNSAAKAAALQESETGGRGEPPTSLRYLDLLLRTRISAFEPTRPHTAESQLPVKRHLRSDRTVSARLVFPIVDDRHRSPQSCEYAQFPKWGLRADMRTR